MPKRFEIVVSPEAERNIEEAFLWISERSGMAAERWYRELMGKLRTLESFPKRCPVAPESLLGLLDFEVRQMLYGKGYWKYRILFKIEGKRVLIAHVRHGARLYLGEEDEGG